MRAPTVLLLALTACGTFNPDEAVSIDQGVYGLTTSGCDSGNCSDSPYEGALISIDPGMMNAAVITTKSDGDGFFEVALAPGEYKLCVYACTTITIADGMRLRRDFVSGPGGGIWCVDNVCGPGN